MKDLIVGASGQVGGQVRRLLNPAKTLITGRLGNPGELPLDLAEIASEADAERALAGAELSGIYCIAGMTAVDLCENEPARAQAINCTGPASLAAAAVRRGISFVFFSTDYVFDGRDGSYIEESATNPESVYGRSKRDGELAVLAAHPGALVLRTTVVYGPDTGKRNNYLYSVTRNLTQGKSMKVPQDQVASPTYNRDLARAAVGLMQRGASGIYHVCGPQRMGRLEFANTIASAWGLDASLLHGVDTVELNQKAKRPLNAGMLNVKLVREFPDLAIRSVKDALVDCRDEVIGSI